jgi:hypothetical protein
MSLSFLLYSVAIAGVICAVLFPLFLFSVMYAPLPLKRLYCVLSPLLALFSVSVLVRCLVAAVCGLCYALFRLNCLNAMTTIAC